MRRLGLLGAVALLSSPVDAQDGLLQTVSDSGHWVGAGEDITLPFDAEEAFFTVQQDGSLYLRLEVPGFPIFYVMAAAAGEHAPTGPGCYERAERMRSPARPAFDIGYDGRTCNDALARFAVHEIESLPDGTIQRLALDFAHHCERRGPSMRGQIRLNSDVPATDWPEPVFKTIGELNVIADADDPIGAGEILSIPLSEQTFTASTWSIPFDSEQILILDNRGMNVPFGWPRSWDLKVRAPAGMPLETGLYESAENFETGAVGLPGLCFGLDSWACSGDFGMFDVQQLEHDRIDRTPIRALVTFDRALVDEITGQSSWLRGSASFHTQIRSGPLVSDVVFLDGLDGEGAWPLSWACSPPSFAATPNPDR
jgi:hypothetical protein